MNDGKGNKEQSGHILIVEDDESGREYFSNVLTAAGFNVKTASTGAEAIVMWEKESFEVLLTDLLLPDMHGRDLAACILSMSPAIEVIMVTGHPSPENTAGELTGHIFAYLIKPVSMEQLKTTVARAFERLVLRQEKEELLQEFKAQVAELEETRRLKKRYLSFIVHELKRPLQALCGASDILKTSLDDDDDGEQATMVRIMVRNSRVMVEMINNILNVEKMKYMTEIENFAEVSVKPLIDEIRRDHATTVANKNLDFLIDMPPDLKVTADARKLKAILSNLISNAVKFTAAGVVSVSAKAVRDTVHFSVSDTGRGMGPDEQGSVRRLLKGFRPAAYAARGTGFGLGFVRDFVKLHGGTVWFESSSAKGTAFHVTIPLKYYMVEQDGHTACLSFLGTRLVSQARELKDIVLAMLENGVTELIIDLSKVEFVDSVDISLMFTLYQMMHARRGVLKLKNLSWQVVEIMRLTQLNQVIELLPG